ncbi:N-acetylmuramoyl-L-alanine amidase [Pseudokordiimonas caeni]|uniref:N-acetylmuramoyl-L-alanine amidase n=1 Tax=Pseudokordiimonas caeni TaxID=2997908 RepID=UPI0028112FE2|nr:N-acetylmuramoyl-L-alanine amidase [Pseudokordiimonas caeni]
MSRVLRVNCRIIKACLAFALWCCTSFAVAAEVAISSIRFGENGDTSRVVLDVDSAIEPRIFLLSGPNRVVIDVPMGAWRGNGANRGIGLIGQFRHGLFDADTYRIVLDLERPALVSSSFALPPREGYNHRYVIDLKSTNAADFAAAVAADKAVASAARPDVTSVAPSVPASRPSAIPGAKKVIVLDAGHGGPDPGTLGVLGVNEKHIVLAMAKAIKAELERTGRYTVKLTRDRDFFIPVRERFVLGRKLGADLFISIHADSIQNPTVTGGSVYSLSETASDKEAERLAARENKSDLVAGLDLNEADDEVAGILIDLAQRETLNYSAQFAEILVNEMKRDNPMLSRAHRYANLGMLKAPDVPSVLIECGYLSNKDDARRLASAEGQRKIARSVSRAVDRYFEHMIALGR